MAINKYRPKAVDVDAQRPNKANENASNSFEVEVDLPEHGRPSQEVAPASSSEVVPFVSGLVREEAWMHMTS